MAASGSVPEIDALAVRVVVDSYQFAVAPSKTQEDVEIQNFGWGIRKDSPPGRTLVRAEMPGKVLRSYTGTRFVFS
jgi:7,8-dihydropterin-6-yl-methyl-4-(beta-D-ribofuranosyl)aminobenzene 5'-phosphate synthase